MKRYSPLIVRGSLLLMESLWIYAFVAWFIAVTVGGEKPTFIGVAVVVFASFGISRGLQNTDISLGFLRFWGAFLSLLVFYAIVRFDYYGDLRLWDLTFLDKLVFDTDQTLSDGATAVMGIPILMVFWIRGVFRGQQSLSFDDVMRSFGVGIIVVGFVSMFAGINDNLPREVDFIAVPYIVIGLLAIGLAHTSRASDQFERGFASDWLVFVGGGLVALAVVALLFVVIDFNTARDGLEIIGRGIGFVVAGILYVIIWPIMQVLLFLMEAMRFLIDLWGGSRNEVTEDVPGEPEPVEGEGEGKTALPGWVEPVLRVMVGSVLATALIIGAAMLFTRYRKDTTSLEARESTYQEGRLANDLGDMLSNLFSRFRGQSRHADGQTEPVRRLYFEMLDVAAARGIERRPMETPLEFVPRINRTIGGTVPEEITRLFDETRYGAHPPSEDDLRRLREEWEGLPK